MKTLLTFIACLISLSAMAQVPPFIRNSLDTNSEFSARNVVTNIVKGQQIASNGNYIATAGGTGSTLTLTAGGFWYGNPVFPDGATFSDTTTFNSTTLLNGGAQLAGLSGTGTNLSVDAAGNVILSPLLSGVIAAGVSGTGPTILQARDSAAFVFAYIDGGTNGGMVFTNEGGSRIVLNTNGIGTFSKTVILSALTTNKIPALDASGRLVNAVGTADGTKFLRDDGTLAVPSGGGSSSSISSNGTLIATNPANINLVGNPNQMSIVGTSNNGVATFTESILSSALFTNGVYYSHTNTQEAVGSVLEVFKELSGSTTNIWEVYSNGVMISRMNSNGWVRLGSGVAPTVALDVTGAGAFSGALTVNSTLSVNANINFDSGHGLTSFGSGVSGFFPDASGGTIAFAGTGKLTLGTLVVLGTNVLSAPAGLSAMGAQLWSDGTNLCYVLQNAAGTRTTNKVTGLPWP